MAGMQSACACFHVFCVHGVRACYMHAQRALSHHPHHRANNSSSCNNTVRPCTAGMRDPNGSWDRYLLVSSACVLFISNKVHRIYGASCYLPLTCPAYTEAGRLMSDAVLPVPLLADWSHAQSHALRHPVHLEETAGDTANGGQKCEQAPV